MAQNGCPGVFEVADHDYDVQIATLTTWGSGTPTKVISVELSQNSSREGKTLGARGFFGSLNSNMASANTPRHLVRPNLDMKVVSEAFQTHSKKMNRKLLRWVFSVAKAEFDVEQDRPSYWCTAT